MQNFLSKNTDAEEKLKTALKQLGANIAFRDFITAKLVEYEEEADFSNKDIIREKITGPIIDALYLDSGTLKKELKNGITFEFIHQSKITRDFILSAPAIPDYVWEPFTSKLLLLLASKAKNVIIGGAYIGDHAILLANKMFSNKGICHAFEPNSISFNMLENNKKINNLDNLMTINKGLWSKKNINLQIVGEDAYAHVLEIHDTNKTNDSKDIIITTTISEYVKEKNIDALDLIMLDIEGGEFMALKGANEVLASSKPPVVVFEIHNNYVDWSEGLENTDIIKYLNSFGYTSFAVRDFHSNIDIKNSPIELIPAKETYLDGPPHGFNMLAIKDVSLIQNNNFRICHNVSPKLLLSKDPKMHHPIDWQN